MSKRNNWDCDLDRGVFPDADKPIGAARDNQAFRRMRVDIKDGILVCVQCKSSLPVLRQPGPNSLIL
jgi:hypothetical protein